jgi:uncharacterized protein YjbI with pentapeptide repeats
LEEREPSDTKIGFLTKGLGALLRQPALAKDLRVDFSDIPLWDADLSRVDLRGVQLTNVFIWNVDLEGADMSDVVEFDGLLVRQTAWWRANLMSQELIKYLNRSAKFNGTRLHEKYFGNYVTTRDAYRSEVKRLLMGRPLPAQQAGGADSKKRGSEVRPNGKRPSSS